MTNGIGGQMQFKTAMLRSSLCHYSHVYILVKGKATIAQQGAHATAIEANRTGKNIAFNNLRIMRVQN